MDNNKNLSKIKSIMLVFITEGFIKYFDNEYSKIESDIENSIEDKQFELETQIYEFATDALTELVPDDTESWEYPDKDSLVEWASEIWGDNPEDITESDIQDLATDELSNNFDSVYESLLKELLLRHQGWLDGIDSITFTKITSDVEKELKSFIKKYPRG